jgi:TonB family protein
MMKISDVMVYWKRREIVARILFLLCSIIFHIFLAYYFYTEEFPIKEMEVEKKVIQIRPVSREEIVFPTIRRASRRERDILDLTPSPVSPGKKPAIKEPDQQSPEPPEKGSAVESGAGTPGKKPEPGKIPDIIKKRLPGKEKLKAPFNPSHYLKVETVADILRRLEEEERAKYRQVGEADVPTADTGDYGGSGDIVVDRKGRAYFRSKGYDISPWARKVVAAVNQNWFVMTGFDTGAANDKKEVGITVTFARDGNVVSAAIKRPSHIQILDQSALNAVKLSAPYPPLPEQYPGSQLTAFFLFKYENE